MSITVADVLALAYALSPASSGNLTSVEFPLFNVAFKEHQADFGGNDMTLDLTTVGTPPLVVGTQDYVFTSVEEIEEIQSVEYRLTATNDWIPLEKGSREDAQRFDQQSGLPSFFYLYRPAGVQTFSVYPKPSADYVVAGATLRVLCRAKQAAVSASADVLYIGENQKGALATRLAEKFATVDKDATWKALLANDARLTLNIAAEDELRTGGVLDFDSDSRVSARGASYR